jgi:hypothetical protein
MVYLNPANAWIQGELDESGIKGMTHEEAIASIIIHEELHQTGVFSPDINNPQLSGTYQYIVMKNCFPNLKMPSRLK